MPRSREQFEEIKSARKQEIINSAIRIFCQKGYDNAKIDDIMQDCGCSHGLMYHYFKNKDEIFRDILKTSAEESDRMYERNVGPCDFSRENLVHMVKAFLRGLEENEDFAYFVHFMSMLNMIRHDFDYTSVGGNTKRRFRPKLIFEEVFRKGQAEGYIRENESPGALATLYLAIIQGIAYQKVFSLNNRTECAVPKPETVLSVFLKDTQF